MRRKKKTGFTLIELIVVVMVIGIFATGAFVAFNPTKQLNKSYDSQRVQDLNTVEESLNLYYQDHNCFPQNVPFGSPWIDGESLIANKVPQDPQMSTNGSYVYFTDTTSTCPQWNAVFSRLSSPSSQNTCSLPPDCVPSGWSSQWACKSSGTLNCKTMLASHLPDLPTILPTQTLGNNPLLQFLLGNKVKTCQYNVADEYPTHDNQVMAHLYKTGGVFLISNPPTPRSTFPNFNIFSLDVSYRPDFGGKVCNSDTVEPFSPEDTSRGADCDTFNGIGRGSQGLSDGSFAKTYNNMAVLHIGGIPNPNKPNYLYFPSPLTTENVKNSDGTYYTIGISKFWSNWQCGKTLYWRATFGAEYTSPVHADYISCDLPPQVATNYYYHDLPYYFEPSWDLNCNGTMEYDDTYRMQFMWIPYNYSNVKNDVPIDSSYLTPPPSPTP